MALCGPDRSHAHRMGRACGAEVVALQTSKAFWGPTTLESTLGGGRKLFLPTFSRWLTLASSCVFTLSREYCESPGFATCDEEHRFIPCLIMPP